jgi:hypothetical protein
VVHVGHAHEPAAAQRRLTSGAVAEAQLADDHRGADVELVAIIEQLHITEPERVPALDAQLEHQPVRQVHQVLVEHGTTAEDRRLAVVDTMRIRAWVVHAVVVLPLRGAPRAQETVAR